MIDKRNEGETNPYKYACKREYTNQYRDSETFTEVNDELYDYPGGHITSFYRGPGSIKEDAFTGPGLVETTGVTNGVTWERTVGSTDWSWKDSIASTFIRWDIFGNSQIEALRATIPYSTFVRFTPEYIQETENERLFTLNRPLPYLMTLR